MRFTIERLRIGIVVLAILLVAVILLFFAVARYERHRLAHDLPEKLGIHIQSSAQGFTFSKSEKGRTLFTLHASKVVQYKGGGRATLHDVSITLYGKQGNRADRIYGADFEYDPAKGIARADGDVQLDIQAPESAGPANSQAAPQLDAEKATIHVKTSGMVFDRNTGIASTPNPVEFHFPQASGKATGANYDSEKGLLVLASAVELTSNLNGEGFVVRSSHAEFLRDSRQAFLLNVIADYRHDRGAANQVILYFRPDGSADHLDAKGNIHLTGEGGREMAAQSGSVQLDQKSQPRTVNMGGGVLFHAEDAQHHVRGTAVEGTIDFGEKGTLRHAQLRDAVSFIDQQVTLLDDPHGSATRQVRAAQLDVEFVTDADRHSSPEKILAAGNAVVVLHTIRSNAPQQNTTLQADTLLASIGAGMALTALDGNGHTRLMNIAADGTTETSTGDTLLVKFDQGPQKRVRDRKTDNKTAAPGIIPARSGSVEIQSALQQGNVTMTQAATQREGKSAPQPPMVATAQRALYTGGDQLVRMEGAPRLVNGSLEITAQSFEFARTTGDALANGDVKSTFQQGGVATPIVFGGQGPVHIVAQQASLLHASGDAVFRGQARLWQGSSSVAAPIVELSRTQQTLKAHGDGPAKGNQPTVHAAFLSPSSTGRPQGVVRISSQQLLYSDAERKAVFHGSVVAQDATGTIHADETEVVLTPTQAPGQKSSGPQAQVDHLVATGHVSLEQAGRKGTGERLVYTTESGLFVLSGSASSPPRLVDPERGTVTGDALIFNSHDDSVSVSGGRSGAVTETRVPR
jgi:lipopolysaccharide export system protein LptA